MTSCHRPNAMRTPGFLSHPEADAETLLGPFGPLPQPPSSHVLAANTPTQQPLVLQRECGEYPPESVARQMTLQCDVARCFYSRASEGMTWRGGEVSCFFRRFICWRATGGPLRESQQPSGARTDAEARSPTAACGTKSFGAAFLGGVGCRGQG